MQTAHRAMDQRIADAIDRRITPTSIVVVDDRQIRHLPFGRGAVSSNGLTLKIAGSCWRLDDIESYDPDTGDFVYRSGERRQTVAVRNLPRAA